MWTYRFCKPRLSKKMLKIYVACFLSMFSSAFAITMMFPFLPFMVEFLLPWLLENEALVATYAGIIASSMFFGRFFGSLEQVKPFFKTDAIAIYVWGSIADRKGRKPVIIVSVVLVGLTSAIFGFSMSYEMAIITRFLVGLTNGAIGTIKAVISEVSDDSNQALGIAMIGLAWGVGIIIGPAVSGALSDPIGQYNLTVKNDVAREFLTRFPYSLPCLVNLALCLLAAVLTFFFLPETLGMKKNRRRSEISEKDIALVAARARTDDSNSTSTSNDTVNTDQESLPGINNGDEEVSESCLLIPDRSSEERSRTAYVFNHSLSGLTSSELLTNGFSVDENSSHSQEGVDTSNLTEQSDDITSSDSKPDEELIEDDQTELLISQSDSCSDASNEELPRPAVMVSKRRQSWGQIHAIKAKRSAKDAPVVLLSFFCDLRFVLSLLIYCLYSFAVLGYNEIYSVWAKTSPHLGGLGFSLSEIGITLTITGVLLLPFPLFMFPLVEKKIGLIRTFYLFSMILIPSVMLLPNVHYLISDSNLKWFLWVLVCLILLVCQVCITVGFSCQMLFINNSVTFDKLGSVNGLAMSLNSIAGSLAPLVMGGLFTVSLSDTAIAIGYPFDYRLVFLVFGSTFLVCVLLVSCLPTSINKQKIIEDLSVSIGDS